MINGKNMDMILMDRLKWEVDEVLFLYGTTPQQVVEVGQGLVARAIFQLSRETGTDPCTLLEAVNTDIRTQVKQWMGGIK